MALMRPAPPAPWLPQGDPRQADRRACSRVLQRQSRGGREGGGAHQVVRQTGGRHAGAAALRRRCSRCSTRRSPRAGATTGRASTSPGVEPALCDKLMEHAARIRSPHSAVILFQHRRRAQPARQEHSPVGQPGRALRPQHHSFLGPSRVEDEVNIEWARDRVERPEVVLDRRHLHQLPDRGRGTGADRGGTGQEPESAGRGEGAVGPGERVSHQPEHHAEGRDLSYQSAVPSRKSVVVKPSR